VVEWSRRLDCTAAGCPTVPKAARRTAGLLSWRIPDRKEQNRFKNDYISPFGFLYGNYGFSQKGNFYAIDEFADKNMITDQQGVFHRTGRYLEGLNNKCSDKEGNNYGNDYCLCVFFNDRYCVLFH